jgi:hypothetical protein
MKVEFILKIRTVSEANSSEHWSKKSKRHRIQKKMVWWLLQCNKPPNHTPVHITLTRIAPRYMDYSNLVSSFKYIEDACAEYFHPNLAPGRADGFGDITFLHKQEKGIPKEYKIKIEFNYPK